MIDEAPRPSVGLLSRDWNSRAGEMTMIAAAAAAAPRVPLLLCWVSGAVITALQQMIQWAGTELGLARRSHSHKLREG